MVRLSSQSSEPEDSMVRRALQLYCKSVDNYRRQVQGLPPIPYTLEELQWERELDVESLKKTLPPLVFQPPRSDIEAQEFRKSLEREVRYRLERLLGYPEE
jgi:hypothetical protein